MDIPEDPLGTSPLVYLFYPGFANGPSLDNLGALDGEPVDHLFVPGPGTTRLKSAVSKAALVEEGMDDLVTDHQLPLGDVVLAGFFRINTTSIHNLDDALVFLGASQEGLVSNSSRVTGDQPETIPSTKDVDAAAYHRLLPFLQAKSSTFMSRFLPVYS